MKWIKKVAATPIDAVAKVIDTLQAQVNDRTNAPSIRAVNDGLARKWEDIYPVGSIYINTNDINPSEIFGGTWQQIKDKFLLASGDTYTNGATGGSATHTPSGTVNNHTLTTSEIPSHSHTYTQATAVEGHVLTEAEIAVHSHGFTLPSGFWQDAASGGVVGSVSSTQYAHKTDQYISQTSPAGGSSGETQAHSHGLTTVSTNTGNSGSGGGHNHSFTGIAADTMPPYLAVNIWVRTA